MWVLYINITLVSIVLRKEWTNYTLTLNTVPRISFKLNRTAGQTVQDLLCILYSGLKRNDNILYLISSDRRAGGIQSFLSKLIIIIFLLILVRLELFATITTI